MALPDLSAPRSTYSTAALIVADEDQPADVSEPPDNRLHRYQSPAEFQKSWIRPQSTRNESLLTKAFHAQPDSEPEVKRSDLHLTTDLTRRRSMMSNASIASTAELTSDGGLTSPARTNTPSPPFPTTIFANFAHYSLASKPAPMPANTKIIGHTPLSEVMAVSPKATPAAQVPKKRCISFVCDGKKEAAAKVAKAAEEAAAPKEKLVAVAPAMGEEPKRKRAIKFACPGPEAKPIKDGFPNGTEGKPSSEASNRLTSRSPPPPPPRRSPRPAVQPRSARRESTATLRRPSHSPVAVRVKPRYIIADEQTLHKSEATRFYEFASEEVQEDDWIRKDAEIIRAKLTINDTLKKENAIRQLGTEAEEEALEDEEDVEDEEDEEFDDENDDDQGEEDDEDQDSLEGSDDDASDGNESDNEAGFAESDESDAEGEFSFWTPGRKVPVTGSREHFVYRPAAHRAASTSSIDSLSHMDLEAGARKKHRRRPVKIRPGTPDLPDSTDFVCGTLDEDRPLEDAYVSCMVVRKNAKHKQTPQDIDPSFPTSDPEDEEDENDAVDTAHDSEELCWLHGEFEESGDERHGRRRSTTMRRRSPGLSPRRLYSPPPPRKLHSPPAKQRLHSPPPPKQRLRSPPPRKLFGHSPKRLRSPVSSQTLLSPAASPMSAKQSVGIAFAPLGSRPGLTHTKSLPRTPNAFCRQYRASRLIAANGNATEGTDSNSGHVRGAIDIVKGLEEKRQRRNEKLHQKQCNRKNKTHAERRPQPGKGAERMRELGLLMAGKTGQLGAKQYVLSA
ncbi:hypothetical protein QTJ16_001142 [Diplocarpon rosae]|uniref:Uncharacterized protein n=1 Tax=Diplocarpon rosae TaxID=946125 RepID=A0AAD9T7J0_9HELO|nr:hypothetical protein QTJ16_001142 [Diplocarpon rosae]PBP29013.1 hypothetical protein BUE80_DR000012 [Diplocarpon rosae]